MPGCTIGTLFTVSIAGGSYQEGLLTHIQGVPPGLHFSEKELYSELLLRKPGQGELTSPRREADVPVLYSGINAEDTMTGVSNRGHTNGTPLVILIPNVDRHFEHIEQYRATNRTPRPGHASYASFHKYGIWDDAIGAGIFSGRYTATIVAAGVVAKTILAGLGIEVIAFVREAAGVSMPELSTEEISGKAKAYREARCRYDPVFNALFTSGKWRSDMRFFEKIALLAELEKRIPDLSRDAPVFREEAVISEYGVHPGLFCPHLPTAQSMVNAIKSVSGSGDSSGGIVEVRVRNLPPGLGEPVFHKLDGELGRMLSIGAVKGVEVGCGFQAATMRGSDCNDAIRVRKGNVSFSSNHAGGITGGLSSGQELIARVAVKPTPTIARPQQTIDKVSMENRELAAVTRRDPSIVPRVWPVVEGFTAMIIVDMLMQHHAVHSLIPEKSQ